MKVRRLKVGVRSLEEGLQEFRATLIFLRQRRGHAAGPHRTAADPPAYHSNASPTIDRGACQAGPERFQERPL